MADSASDECAEAPCAADTSSNGSARGSAAFTNYYRHQLAPLLGADASDSRGLLGQPPAFWLRPLGCGQHAVCRSCAQPRFVSQASRVRGKPSRRRCAHRSLSPSGSPDGTQPRTRCATRWRQSTLPLALPRRAGRCLGTLTGWRGRPVRPDVSSLQPCGWHGQPATVQPCGLEGRIHAHARPAALDLGSSTCRAPRSRARAATPRSAASGRGEG